MRKWLIFVLLIQKSVFGQIILPYPVMIKAAEALSGQKAYAAAKFLTPSNPWTQYLEVTSYQRGVKDYFSKNTLLTKDKLERSEFYKLNTFYNFDPAKRDRGVKLSAVPEFNKPSEGMYCPYSMESLMISRAKLYPYYENTLSFSNQAHDLQEVMMPTLGFCWGHAYTTSSLRYLAFFDENNYKRSPLVKNSLEWERVMKNKIYNVVINSEPEVFPYIGSIRELSELFEIELKKMVVKAWGMNAPTLMNYFNTIDNENHYSRDYLDKLILEIKSRLALGQSPIINFNLWGDDKWSHVVLVYGYGYSGDKVELYLDDNKFTQSQELPDQRSKIIIDLTTRKIRYSLGKILAGDDRVGQIRLPMEDYLFYGRIYPKLYSFCKKQKD